MFIWRNWRILKDLLIEIGLIICVNTNKLYNSPLHRLLEYEMMKIDLKRDYEIYKNVKREEFREKYGK